MTHQPKHVIDTHQHLWVISERKYEWLVPEYGVIYSDFRPEDVAADVKKAGITGTVLVQAADNYDDTFYMMSVAAADPSIVGVVGWVPFDRTAEAQAALETFAKTPIIKGYRNLTHNYDDSQWILQDSVTATLKLLSNHGYPIDMVSVNPDHNRAIIALGKLHPELRIVVDHMAKPPIANGDWEPWATQMSEIAALPNLHCKLSGLNTASSFDGWKVSDWQRYVDHCMSVFGSERMMLGSDWPVSLLNGDFQGVWQATMDVISGYSAAEQDNLCFKTAEKFYSLKLG